MDYNFNNYPDIYVYNDENPTITSPNADFDLEFCLTRDTALSDMESFAKMIESGVSIFRKSRTYTHYKSYLYNLGINCCQFHPNIKSNDENDMAKLEMHHCMLTIHDISTIITTYVLNTYGKITSFDLAELLKIEHIECRVPTVMLCKTCHQQYHHKYLYIHPNMIFGKWWELIEKYNIGLDRDLTYHLYYYLNKALSSRFKIEKEKAEMLLKLRSEIKDWSCI